MDANNLAVERRRQFELNCAEYRRQVFYFVLSMIRNKTVAEEITQDTILRFLEFMEKRRWEEDVRNVKAYLITIAKMLCYDWWRRPSEEEQMDSGDEQSEQIRKALERKAMQENDPTARIVNDIYYGELYKSLPKSIWCDLTEEELRLFYLHSIMEMTPKEIAQADSKDADSIQGQLNRLNMKIRYRAREWFKKTGGDEALC
jgi:RNA polymerase sigma factor (sigma-70 family)